MIILFFFIGHCYFSLFAQLFFLHSYSSYKRFKMNSFWEKFFYLFAFVSQGSSFLSPRAYAVIHRMHHSYNDEGSRPGVFRSIRNFVVKNKNVYMDYREFGLEPEIAFGGSYPMLQFIDRIGDMLLTRFMFACFYIAFYVRFATHWWMFALLPLHFCMGPIHAEMIKLSDSNFVKRVLGKDPTYPVVKVLQVMRIVEPQRPLADDNRP